jgi:hypothetical protein
LEERELDDIIIPLPKKVVGTQHPEMQNYHQHYATMGVKQTILEKEQLRRARPVKLHDDSALILYTDDLSFASKLGDKDCCNNPEKDRSNQSYLDKNRNEDVQTNIPEETFEHHLPKLEIPLVQLLKSKLTISPKKSLITSKHVNVLGVAWRPGKITLTEVRIRALRDMARPKTPEEAKSFVSTFAYNRNFIKNFQNHTAPIHELARMKGIVRKIKWEKKHEDARQALIDELNKNRTLHCYTPDHPVMLSIDASDIAIGGVLDQVIDGDLHPISNFSRMFLGAEQRQGMFKK